MKYRYDVRLLGIVRGESHEAVYERMLAALDHHPEFTLTKSNLDMWVDGANGTVRDFDGLKQFDVIIVGSCFGQSLAQVQSDIIKALKQYPLFSVKAVNVEAFTYDNINNVKYDDNGEQIPMLPPEKTEEATA